MAADLPEHACRAYVSLAWHEIEDRRLGDAGSISGPVWLLPNAPSS
ncbi:MAG: hypothetical protein R2734_15055 [Nocardioides sp.]